MTSASPTDPLFRLVGVEAEAPDAREVETEVEESAPNEGREAVRTSSKHDIEGRISDSSPPAPDRESPSTRTKRAGGRSRSNSSRSAIADSSLRDHPKRSIPDGVDALVNTLHAGTAPEMGNVEPASGTAAGHTLDHSTVLERLTPTVELARGFAERWEAAYRPAIFSIAMEMLLGQLPNKRSEALSPETRAARSRPLQSSGESSRSDDLLKESLDPAAKIARKLEIQTEDVERAVLFGEDDRITLIGHIEGTTKRELQTRYALIYCFIKEIAFGDALVDIEELRRLCIDHGCYDLANFTGNFRKDVKTGLMREIGVRGSRSRQYRLAKKGLDEAAALLREIAEQ